MIEQLRELAEWHRVEAEDHRTNADLFDKGSEGRAEMLAAAESHAKWAELLGELITAIESETPLAAKVIEAGERDRRGLTTRIAELEAEKSQLLNSR